MDMSGEMEPFWTDLHISGSFQELLWCRCRHHAQVKGIAFCRTTLGKYLDVAYQAKFNELRGLLNKQTGVALTTDMWSSAANEGYLTITAHFVDGTWNLNNFVLTTRSVEDRHTGLNIANEIRTMVALFDIRESQLVGLVSDNVYNMVACGKALDWPHFPCFAHSLQLAIRNGFDAVPQIKNAIAAGKRVAAHFRRSVLATKELTLRQKQMDLPSHKLIIDCPTRWNSTYSMFERLFEQRLAVYAIQM